MHRLKLTDKDYNPQNYDKLVSKEQFDDMVEKFIDLNEDFELSDLFQYMVQIVSMKVSVKAVNTRVKSKR